MICPIKIRRNTGLVFVFCARINSLACGILPNFVKAVNFLTKCAGRRWRILRSLFYFKRLPCCVDGPCVRRTRAICPFDNIYTFSPQHARSCCSLGPCPPRCPGFHKNNIERLGAFRVHFYYHRRKNVLETYTLHPIKYMITEFVPSMF